MITKNVVLKKYLCCSDLTITARLISLVGITVATLLASVLVHDNRKSNYAVSRKTALALGLDWQHFNPNANATNDADPEGRLISIIVIFYSLSYLLTSMTLLIGTVLLNRWLTIPWLLFELFGYVSKFAAVIAHAVRAEGKHNHVLVIGSILYILIMTWWWLVVFAAQYSWNKQNNSKYGVGETNLPMTTVNQNVAKESDDVPPKPPPTLVKQKSTLDSPLPYRANDCYTSI